MHFWGSPCQKPTTTTTTVCSSSLPWFMGPWMGTFAQRILQGNWRPRAIHTVWTNLDKCWSFSPFGFGFALNGGVPDVMLDCDHQFCGRHTNPCTNGFAYPCTIHRTNCFANKPLSLTNCFANPSWTNCLAKCLANYTCTNRSSRLPSY